MKKLRRGWFKKAKVKWVRERLYSFSWYSSEFTTISAWIRWQNGSIRSYSRGFSVDIKEEQAFDSIIEKGFFEALRIRKIIHSSKLYWHKRVNLEENGE